MSWKDGSVGRWLVKQQVGEADDGGQHVVEIVRDAAGELADRLHLLALRELRLERALLGRLQRVDDGGVLALIALQDGAHEEAHAARRRVGEGGVDGGNVALARDRRVDRRRHRRAVGFLHQLAEPPPAPVDRPDLAEEHDEAGVGERDAALPVDRGDRHRRVVEEAGEAHLGDAARLRLVAEPHVEDERARGADRAVGGDRHAVQEARRQARAVGAHEVEIERLGLGARRARRLDHREPLDADDVAHVLGARLELGEVDADPFGERGVQVADAPVRLEREEAGRRMVEIVDGVLQLLKNVLLVLALARDVGDEPADMRIRPAGRADAHPVPARPVRPPADAAGHADLLGGAAALVGRHRQPVDRFRGVRIVGEEPLDGMQLLRALRAGKLQVGGVRPERRAVRRAHQHALGHVLHEGLRLPAVAARGVRDAREREHAGRAGEQRHHADRGEHAEAGEHDEARRPFGKEQKAAGDRQQDEHQRSHQDKAAATGSRSIFPPGPALPHFCRPPRQLIRFARSDCVHLVCWCKGFQSAERNVPAGIV